MPSATSAPARPQTTRGATYVGDDCIDSCRREKLLSRWTYHMKRLAVIVIACISCGPQDDGRGTGSTGGKGDGGVVTCGTHPKDTDGDGISDKDEGADEKP